MSNDGASAGPLTIGSLVRGARRRAGLTQAQLGAAAGLSVRTLRDIEHGQIRSPDGTAVTKVIEVLGLNGGTDDPALNDRGRSGGLRAGQPLRIGVLGPLVIRRGTTEVMAGSPRLRAALAVLALQAGEPVSREELAEAAWGTDQPASWTGALSTHISRLRALTGAAIVLRGEAYCLLASDQETDAAAFHALLAEAGSADQPAGRRCLEAALRCWRGPVLADLDSRLQHSPAAAALSRLRVRTALRYADLALACGEPEPAAELLAPVAEQEPLDEAVQARLIAAMAAAGQRAGALAQYEAVRCRLADELGIDPGGELKAVLHQVLTQRGAARRQPAARQAPAQLPVGSGEFTGRSEQLCLLDEAARGTSREPAATGVICTITGTAGVGKTALALHWAHRARGRFTGGQLYANLHGFGPLEPTDPSVILDQFLRAMDVPAADIPASLDARAALLRSVLAGRRVLLVLDNARHADQVRPLLPGGAPSVVLVTSRSRLEGLGIRENARSITVEPFTRPEATALLAELAGQDTATAEPAAIARIAGYCAGLPLALRIAGQRAAGNRGLPLATLAEELDDAGARLDELVTPGDEASSVRSVFSWSYRALPAAQQQLFRQLSLHPGSGIGVAAAAALAALDLRQARLLLNALAAASLLQQPHPDRYELHDLLRAYAAELSTSTDPAPARTAAMDRMISYYTSAAADAAGRDEAPQTPPPGKASAARWLDTELPNLSALAAATPLGHPSPAMDLSAILWRYLETRGRHSDAVILHSCAVAAATSSGDQARAGQALTCLGLACWRLGRLAEAVGHYEAALACAERSGDNATRARALTEIAAVCEHLGRYAAAHEFSLQALELARKTGDRMLQGKAISNLGVLCWHQQRYASALERYEQSRALAEEVGDRVGQANALANIGHCLIGMTRYAEALGQLTGALAISEELGHAALTAEALDSTAQALVHLGRCDEAMEQHRRALEIVRTTLDRNLEADILNGFAETAAQTGGLSVALTYHHQALAITAASGDRRQAARAHEGLASALRASGDPAGAREHLREAIAIYADLGVPKAGQLRELLSQIRN